MSRHQHAWLWFEGAFIFPGIYLPPDATLACVKSAESMFSLGDTICFHLQARSPSDFIGRNGGPAHLLCRNTVPMKQENQKSCEGIKGEDIGSRMSESRCISLFSKTLWDLGKSCSCTICQGRIFIASFGITQLRTNKAEAFCGSCYVSICGYLSCCWICKNGLRRFG